VKALHSPETAASGYTVTGRHMPEEWKPQSIVKNSILLVCDR